MHFLIEGLICWVVTAVIGFKIIKDVIWWTGFIKWQSWSNAHLWEGLAIFIIFHFSVVSLAFLYRRIFSQLSLVFIYLNLQLFFYLLFLIKGLFLACLPEQSWWLMIYAVLLIFWRVLPKNKPEGPVYKNGIPLFGKVLIGIWVLSSVCLWIPDNWDANRKVFVDEGSFWVNAGEQMVKMGINAAHKVPYPGGGLHPLGIPFMVSAPMTWSGWRDSWAIYCWPLVIIFSLGLWLFSQRWGKWALLFFMSSLLVVFSNDFWPAQLMYQLVYGESICVILVLVFLSEIWFCVRKSAMTPGTMLALSGAIGLLALTKAPSNMIVIPLELTFLFLVFRYQRSMINAPLVIGCLGFSLFPLLIWSVYVRHFHILLLSTSWHFLDLLGRIPHPDTGLLLLSLKSMWGLDQNMVYVICLSIVMIGLTAFSMRFLMVPVLLWIMAWFFYYAYIYNYSTGQGDYLSGLRYMIPVVLALYWAAACAYQEAIDYLFKKNTAMAHLLQGLSVIFLIMILFFRKCFLI